MQDFEKLGVFYLGREYDLETKTARPDLLLYKSNHLMTHAVCVGMTGSGKTGLCLALLEEAAIDGIPALVIDPKGDLGNLLLTFPELRPADFQPWIDPAEATRKGTTPEDYAAQTARQWQEGLASWGQDGARIARFREAVDLAIYTPGSSAGLGLTVLRSFAAPSAEILTDGEALRERVAAAASGLLALLGIDADPLRSREHILLSTLFDRAWRGGQDIDLGELIRSIQSPPFDKIGVMDLESIFPAKDRAALAVSLNNLLASPGFSAWMEGEPLDIQRLLYTPEGKPRHAILSIAHLTDAERMFFVTILLNEVIAWMRRQPGTSSLRALLYMDEVFGYFPPTANPPSKTPMLTLLKQARAFGLGVMLATQNPVDLDYKGLSNAGTWFLGRLQTERDKARVLDGLEGASAAAGAQFDRGRMEKILSGLGNRVFLLNNVHEDQPVVFQTRWALSYLRGPLTRDQIQKLMRDKKSQPPAAGENRPAAAVIGQAAEGTRPMLPPDVPEVFLSSNGGLLGGDKLRYRPGLLAQVRIHYQQKNVSVDYTADLALLIPVVSELSSTVWDQADSLAEEVPDTQPQPEEQSLFETPPTELLRAKTFKELEAALKNHVYRTARLEIWKCPETKECSRPGETEGDFRARLTHGVKEKRDAAIEKLQAKFTPKLATLEERLRKAQQRLDKQKSQATSQMTQAAVSIGTTILGALFGRKLASSSNVTRAASTIRSATKIASEQQDVAHANESVEAVQAQIDQLNADFTAEAAKIQENCASESVKLETISVSPKKTDITLVKLALAWTPWIQKADGTAAPSF
ncbi:MAG: ATP-binding protein [Planctomycetes bacterium]|nr:ATP-binding protein [Planctomycetota bacterium]